MSTRTEAMADRVEVLVREGIVPLRRDRHIGVHNGSRARHIARAQAALA